jgi:integrase-like protein/Arm domain-containing DNA-binding protein
MGLGSIHTMTLPEAREKARELRLLRLEGIDPIAHRNARLGALRAADAKAKTFKDCAREFIRDNESKWTNPRHHQQWEDSLTQYVYPVLGTVVLACVSWQTANGCPSCELERSSVAFRGLCAKPALAELVSPNAAFIQSLPRQGLALSSRPLVLIC